MEYLIILAVAALVIWSLFQNRKINQLEKEAQQVYEDRVRAFYRVNNKVSDLGAELMSTNAVSPEVLERYIEMNKFVTRELYVL